MLVMNAIADAEYLCFWIHAGPALHRLYQKEDGSWVGQVFWQQRRWSTPTYKENKEAAKAVDKLVNKS